MFVIGKLQRIGDAVDHLDGGMDVLSLLKSGVPAVAHPSQVGNFFTPETTNPTGAQASAQTCLLWRQRCPPRTQERRKFAAPLLGV
ncbi:hypothetical protein MANY_08260 [Mycolicibacterium anyangense]|uniref:Uncharacterized protein n=1 Tax=Mycolicibacterium anyangense TaxID=1431246 RepID=A0A6N4W3A9_9MYCO|nr:hypothetical protein MANY_08260 [Mycolicibacterium anyangense]